MNEYLDLLRHNRNFRNLWLGSVISQFGDWFNVIAAAELITRLTDSGVALSYLFISRFLPLFVFSPVAGVLADRFDRKHLMVISDALRGLTVLGFLLIRDPADIWLFYLLTVVQFSLSALFTPARGAMLAGVVRRDELVAANALDGLTWSTMMAVGALAGGVVAAFFGAETAFLADSLTFLLSAYVISKIALPQGAPSTGRHLSEPTETPSAEAASPQPLNPTPAPAPAPIKPAPARRFAFLDGFRYLLREPFILGIALGKAAASLVYGSINVLEITYANDLFPLTGAARFGISDPGTATLGIIYVFVGLGTGVGPLLMRRWLGDAPRRLMLGTALAFGFMTLGVAWMAVVDALTPLLAATVIRTVGTGSLWIFTSALLQTIVPDGYRGRVFSFEFAALTLTQSISALAGGHLLDTAGITIQEVMGVFAAVSVVMTGLWVAFHLRYLRPLREGRIPVSA